ncbi:hypothetical protein AB0G67_40095 [Streptomyces sp. NPDC021056]|uniref:hypothetical protein n=1 Tax=Streptomyces sp. NPDC021056 TaxID=3155012 RepID=UPI00340FC3AF
MYGTAQEIEHTTSRWSAPRKWLTAIRWLIGAGLHPKANATTQRVADDLASRMDYTTGHARYCLLETAARLGVDKATVKRHVKYLRELGALAWVQHGSHANVRPLHDLPGYAATATVYAATIPPSYDHAMGHTIVGTGYTARIVIDMRDCNTSPKATPNTPVDNPGNPPVDNFGAEGLAPPSRTGVKEVGQVDLVGGGFNYTEQARPRKAQIPRQRSQINGRPRTAADVQKAGKTVRLVRALVNWTQSVPLRRLEYVLRPWTDRGWDAMRIADELNGMCAGVRWKPKNPVAFIRARIAQDTAHQAAVAQAVAPMDNAAWRAFVQLRQALAIPAVEPERTDADRLRARANWNVWPEVLDHLADDQDDAIDLYGEALCKYAISQQARTQTADYAY